MEKRNDQSIYGTENSAWTSTMKKGAVVSLLLISCLASCGVGFVMATPMEPEASEVLEKGLFSATTSQVLSATVESLRAENKLLVFSYNHWRNRCHYP